MLVLSIVLYPPFLLLLAAASLCGVGDLVAGGPQGGAPSRSPRGA